MFISNGFIEAQCRNEINSLVVVSIWWKVTFYGFRFDYVATHVLVSDMEK